MAALRVVKGAQKKRTLTKAEVERAFHTLSHRHDTLLRSLVGLLLCYGEPDSRGRGCAITIPVDFLTDARAKGFKLRATQQGSTYVLELVDAEDQPVQVAADGRPGLVLS